MWKGRNEAQFSQRETGSTVSARQELKDEEHEGDSSESRLQVTVVPDGAAESRSGEEGTVVRKGSGEALSVH